MQYRKIGKSDLELSVIAYGAWAAGGWMWGGADQNAAMEAIRASVDIGVTSIDTAPVYGQGTSEQIVGVALKGIPRDKVQILTKYGLRWDAALGEYSFSSFDNNNNPIDIYRYARKDSILKECEESLRRLKTDYIDLYQIHWPDSTTPIEETMEAVSLLMEQGKVRYAGVCNYNVAQISEASRYVDIISNQVKYSMLSREIEQELVPHLISNQQSVVAYSPLERGLLTGKIQPGHVFAPGDSRAESPMFQDEVISRVNDFLALLLPIAHEKGATLGQLVLRWTADQPGVACVLAGARDARQAIENAQAMQFNLEDQEREYIMRKLEEL